MYIYACIYIMYNVCVCVCIYNSLRTLTFFGSFLFPKPNYPVFFI